MRRTLKWFTNRIGKKVYRDKISCQCESCVKGGEDGVFVYDEDHAKYLENQK